MSLSRPTSLDLSSDSAAAAAVLGPAGATPSNPAGPRSQVDVLAGLSEDQLLLGKVQPYWIPDSEASNCMICSIK